ncbi:MAG: COX15/CtaA family protein [Deltaproteobacteria bacterium]|nr:COX15/CtaA family protein [Deltaproteobacteria bacterium]MBK8239286.1 COX15/CtaA family protein [Deltaproteobacteria bacterium]MBK8719638.1 COX15/CtaA family protein [Deltaproteobacteria bacterium]MBP7289666.1 COX15/CtaA family protein [Nannocystaceae bacterium]
MKPLRLALATAIATWILLLIGGLVNPMGASMACPDWYFIPTCNGELLPEMKGGVLYEHGHRLWASWVGILTLALAIVTWKSKHADATAKRYAVVALLLVCVQGALGGITVKLNLSSAVSTLHLSTAMAFFLLLIALVVRLLPGDRAVGSKPSERGLVLAATVAVFAQIMLGGLVRHLGAGLICGDDIIGCGPGGWTKQPLAHLHMTHRFVAYALVPLVLLAARHAGRQAAAVGNIAAARIARWPAVLIAVQIGLGLATIASGRSAAIVTFHTGVGALVLASLWTCWLLLGRTAARSESGRGR